MKLGTALGIIFGSILLFGCSSLEFTERSNLNHPAMELGSRLTPARSQFLTNLGSIETSGAGGGCTACAH